MAHLLLASSYHLSLDPHARAEGKPYPPLGPAVAATELAAAGHDVALWDATFQANPEDFALGLAGHRPRKVAVLADAHAVSQKMCLLAQRDAALTQIRLAKEAGADVLAAGPDVTDHPETYLQAGADVAVRGEADRALLAFAAGSLGEDAPGAMRPGGRRPEAAPPRDDLESLPPVDWSRVDLGLYALRWRSRHGYWEAPVSSARGCPYRCNWCAKPTWGRSLSLRPPEAVVADCRELGARGADRIWFTDDIFGLKRAWLQAFRVAVDQAGGIPPYRCLARADLVARAGWVEDLRATGCLEVWMGAESGAQHVLDAMDKDQTVAEVAEATRRLHEAGIRVGFFLQLGYPGETAADLESTLEMVATCAPDEIGISVAYPLPGTPFYERVKDKLVAENWETAMDNKLLFAGDYPQAFYDAAREVLRREQAIRHARKAAIRLTRPDPATFLADLKRVGAVVRHLPGLPGWRRALRDHGNA